MSQAGVGFWLTDPKQVRQLADQLAKAQFAAKRDPHDCALMYIALGKRTLLQVWPSASKWTCQIALLHCCVKNGFCASGAEGGHTMLQGLFRSAQHKKQAEFLGRSFDSDKDRAAAAKNAFVLLAQHRPQLAAAFFILGATLMAYSQPNCFLESFLTNPPDVTVLSEVPSSTPLQSCLADGRLHRYEPLPETKGGRCDF